MTTNLKKLKTQTQFKKVLESGITKVNKYVIIKFLPNDLKYSRIGYSVRKRLGKAVIRNRIKRLFREAVRRINIVSGYDIIIIARQDCSGAKFKDIKLNLENIFSKSGLIRTV